MTDTETILVYYIVCGHLKIFENRVLRRIFGPRTDETEGRWRKLHNEELHNM
jgi:hypothetical protein